MKLYYVPGSCALAVHIVLEWIGEPYEVHQVNYGDPELLKINTLGAVPVLETEGRNLNQADAILKYLLHRYPQSNLGADGTPMAEYELDRWLAFLTGDFHPAFYPVFVPQRYTISESTQDHAAVKSAGEKLVDKFLTYLDDHLASSTHMALNKRTITDPYAFAMLRWAQPLDNFKNVRRFFDSMMSDQGVRSAMETQGLE